MSPGDEEELRSAALQNAQSIFTARQRAEQALRRSESQLQQLADSLPQMVWASRPDGFIDYYNERWYEYTGFARDSFGDASWAPILHPDDLQRCLDTWSHSIRSGELYQIEYRFMDRQTGGYRWFLGRAFPVRDEHGNIYRWFGTCTDIDETKRNEETTRFLATASAALADVMHNENTLQRVAALAVPAFADWCAIDMFDGPAAVRRVAVMHSDPAKTQLVQDIFDRYPRHLSDPGGPMKVMRTGELEWAEHVPDESLPAMCRDDEHLRIVREVGLKSCVCTPLRSRDGVLGAITFVMSESGRTYTRREVAAAEALADRAAVAVENAMLVARLKESDRKKDEFLAILAHELRNPLAPIRHAAEVLRAADPTQAQSNWAREVIERQVGQMTRLVDDLLDISRITTDRLELRRECVALSTVVSTAVEVSRPLIGGRGHTLILEVPPESIHVDGDHMRLAQVLSNLLNNAAKYTSKGGTIWLTVGQDGTSAVIKVRDTGAGIPPDLLPRVFEMFTQLDRSLERSQGGLGIGLTLVQRLVTLHGGTVEARSEGLERGSEFVVRLPALAGSPNPVPDDGATELAVSGFERRRILVVDDNRDGADSLAMLLRMLGSEVQTVYDGLNAVAAAGEFRPDVILMDIGLPGLNGYEAARRIRNESSQDVILIAVTGWGQEEDRRKAYVAGFDHHLTKPVDASALREILSTTPPRLAARGS